MLPRTKLLGSLCALAFLATALSAQVTITQLNSTADGDFHNSGQSFTPNVGSVGTVTSTLALNSISFFKSNASEQAFYSTPVYVQIYTSLSGATYSGFVGASTNTQTWSALNAGDEAAFSFSGVQLTSSVTYYAVFSTTSTGTGGITGRGLKWDGTNSYAGGDLIHGNSSYAGLDAKFTVSMGAIPEPSTYAALGGLAALAFVVIRRRRA